MIKILHIADLHLDSPFASLTRDKREEMRAELREALVKVCDRCRREKVDVMLVAGDLFESEYISDTTPEFVSSCFASIPDTRIFISPGNHDPYTSRSPYRSARFSENVHIFDSERLTSVDIPELNTTVYGFGFTDACVSTEPLSGFTVSDTGRINLLCAHGELGTAPSRYCRITPESLAASLLDYAALGHIHTPSGFTKHGKTVTAYSGCLMGRGFDECGKRGAIIGEITPGGSSLKYVTVGKTRYERVEIDLCGEVSEQEIIRLAADKCRELEGNVYLNVVLCGSVTDKITLTEGRLALSLPESIKVTLTDKTVYTPDISKLLAEKSLRGEFCRRVLPYLDSDDEQQRRKGALALELFLKIGR